VDAGVSIATVSHVINRSKNVSEPIACRVRESIERLNYYPNQVSGGLRLNKTYTVGLLIPTITNETFARLADSIQGILFEQGFNLIVCNTHYDVAVEEKALNTLMMKRVDAVLAIPAAASSPKLEEIAKSKIPVILLDRVLQGLQADTVAADNYQGEYLAINYLIRKGHRHIGYVDRMTQQSHSLAQRQGYLDALRDNGIPFDEKYMVNATGHYYHAGMSAAQTLMQRCKKISAIACYYDLMAFGVIRGLLDLGYRVPEDVSVIGYDNMLFTEASYPRLTTVETPSLQLAQEACKLVIRRLQEAEETRQAPAAPAFEPVNIVFEPRLIIRESVRDLPPDANTQNAKETSL
jgi:LacI family transcriptional regulator